MAKRALEGLAVGRRDSLRYVKFGSSDMKVSELCVGTMTWGSFIKDEKAAWAQLDKAFEHGANFIDTAELYPVAFNYGKTTEKWCGNWLAARLSDGTLKRESVYVATKCNASMIGGAPEGETPKPHGYDAATLERSCRASLERLQLDYLDLYQLHWPSRDTTIFGCANFYPGNPGTNKNRPMPCADELPPGSPGIDVFERQVLSIKRLLDLGLIKYWGLSNENAFGITMFCMTCDRLGVPRPVSCQNDFSLLNRSYEKDTWEAAYRFGVVGLPYGALSGGVLTGKYFDGSRWAVEADADRPLAESRLRAQPDFQARYGMPVPMLAAAKYVALAEAYGISPTELALAWSNQRQCNAAVITGTCTVLQMEQCVAAFKLDLPDELMTAVDVIHEEFRDPTAHYHDKAVCLEAPWLAPDKRMHAKHPRKAL